MFMMFGRVEHRRGSGGSSENSPAATAGFQPGDLVKSIDGAPIRSFEGLQASTLMSTGLPMNFVVDRKGQDVQSHGDAEGYGRRSGRVRQAAHGPARPRVLGRPEGRADRALRSDRLAPAWGAGQVWFIVKASTAYVVGLFAGRESADQVSGLIGAAQMAGEMAKISLWELFSLAAWFSVSVGFMNLLPIPLLDGGHLVFYACEAVLGRPVSERMQEIGLRSELRWLPCWSCSRPRTTFCGSWQAAINHVGHVSVSSRQRRQEMV